jgi:hypothetical protein
MPPHVGAAAALAGWEASLCAYLAAHPATRAIDRPECIRTLQDRGTMLRALTEGGGLVVYKVRVRMCVYVRVLMSQVVRPLNIVVQLQCLGRRFCVDTCAARLSPCIRPVTCAGAAAPLCWILPAHGLAWPGTS